MKTDGLSTGSGIIHLSDGKSAGIDGESMGEQMEAAQRSGWREKETGGIRADQRDENI